MATRYPLPFVALIAATLPFGLAACQSNKAPTGTSSTAAQMDPFNAPPPSEFDDSKIEPDGVKSVDGQVTKDIKKWALPTDPYIPARTNSTQVAQDLYMYKCLTGKNVQIPKPTSTYTPPSQPHPDLAADGFTMVLTPENAKKYGYTGGYNLLKETYTYDEQFNNAIEDIRQRGQVTVEHTESDGTTWEEGSEDPAKANDPQYKALSECEQSMFEDTSFLYGADTEIADGKEPTFEDYLKGDPTLAVSHFVGDATPQVKKALEEWKACMRPLGIADLPEDPREMPSPSLSEKLYGNISEDNPIPDQPLAEEVAVAVKDAECRQSSGWLQKSYDIQWAFLQDYVKENKKTLAETKKREDEAEQKRLEYIKANQ